MTFWMLLIALCVQELSPRCFAGVYLNQPKPVDRKNLLKPNELDAVKEHVMISGKLLLDLGKQQLKLLSGLTGTILGGDLIADIPVGEITKYNLGDQQGLTLQSNVPLNLETIQSIGSQQSVVQQSSGQQSGRQPLTNKIGNKNSVASVAYSNGKTGSTTTTFHKPISVSVTQIHSADQIAFPDSSEEDYFDIDWNRDPIITRKPFESKESTEEHFFEGSFITQRRTTPAPWEVNPLSADYFHVATMPGAPVLESPPAAELDPDMYPVLLPAGVMQKPQTNAGSEFNPLVSMAQIGHW